MSDLELIDKLVNALIESSSWNALDLDCPQHVRDNNTAVLHEVFQWVAKRG